MFKTNFKFILRNFCKYKIFSFINLTGLIIGITASLLIFMYVINELSFENIHKNRDKIYRINTALGIGNSQMRLAGAMAALAPSAALEITGIEKVTRFIKADNINIKYGEKKFTESRFFYADTSFFKIFTFPVVMGNFKHPLNDPSSVVITESVSKKLFGNENPIGQTLKCDNNDLLVSAVIKDIPINTQLQWDYLAPFSLYEKNNPSQINWQQFGSCFTYLLMKNNSNDDLDKNLNNLYAENAGKEMASFIKLYPQKLTDIYLHSEIFVELGPKGNITYVYLFSLVAVLILIIACFNFINLYTARSIKRVKEIGIKKVIGANRHNVIKEFLCESFFITGIAVIISIVVYGMLNPFMSSFLGYRLSVYYLNNPYFYLLIGFITFVVGFLSGIYPAFVLSKYKAIETLKGMEKPDSAGIPVRKVLVVFQFAMSIFLIIATLSIFRQLHFMRNAELGFDKSNLILLNFPASLKGAEAKYRLLKERLLQNTCIKSVSGVYTLPGIHSKEVQTVRMNESEQGNKKVLRAISVDYDFVNTLGASLISGRNFSKQYRTDEKSAVILNETAVKLLGLNNPFMQSFYIPDENKRTKEVKIIGVVKDFHISSLKDKIDACFFYINPQRFSTVAIKISANQTLQAINHIKNEWIKIFPDEKINYSFMEEKYTQLYSSEEKLAKLFIIFSIMAILIAGLGLFGLAVFSVKLKTKEIGIRKVLGANITTISIMLSKNFIKWVLFANIIAWPVAYYFMNRWLQNFAYRIEISWWVFVFSSGMAILVALATVIFHALKAAMANPIEALKYE